MSTQPVSRQASPTTDRPLRELRGVVERITFQNPDSGFTVARLAPERAGAEAEAARGDDRLVTVVGTLADLTPGEAIVAHGWWRNDPRNGWQFLAVDYPLGICQPGGSGSAGNARWPSAQLAPTSCARSPARRPAMGRP